MRRILYALIPLLLLIAIPAVAAPPWYATCTVTGGAVADNTTCTLKLPGAAAKARISTIAVYVPTITTATVKLQVSADDGTTFADLYSLPNGTNIVRQFSASGGGGFTMTWPDVDFQNFTHIKIVCSAGQASDRVFGVSGNVK